MGRFTGPGANERKLRWVLVLLFVALALPTAAVLWQAYGQLRWEAFHQYRGQAEELTQRIDQQLVAAVNLAEGRGFDAYAFLNVSGDPGAGFLQRSPLSAVPVVEDVPGTIGYFQVGADGQFTSPLLPDAGSSPDVLGITPGELEQRQSVTGRIRTILEGNRLVDERGASGEEKQALFDRLNLANSTAQAPRQEMSADSVALVQRREGSQAADNSEPSRLKNLQLDESYQRKSQALEADADDKRMQEPESAAAGQMAATPPAESRSRRLEQAALLEPVVESETDSLLGEVAEEERLYAGRQDEEAPPSPAPALRIRTFESEVDPYQFAMLDSGEFVLFRTVWRDGARTVQGAVVDRERFIEDAIIAPFQATTLSTFSQLVVGYGEDMIRLETPQGAGDLSTLEGPLEGDLLYRRRLSSPLDALELVFSVEALPPGPGASVLKWTTLLLVVVFGLGFLALYRLGLGQIRLARQQQDFVSAVSHELKTPLTSIRMYSEMLLEGWTDETRRSQYYGFIHEESERLTRLISNVLQLASMTRNAPSFETEVISTEALLDQARSRIASQAERAGFEILVEADEPAKAARINVDPDCVMQIVINLVDNAIKFAAKAEPRRIVLGASGGAGDVTLAVRDHGPGIAKDQMRKIFRMFYRPESELTRETVGTGIGLAIVHQLTVAMGGRVDVLNREPGAEFRLTFPVVDQDKPLNSGQQHR